MRNDVEWTLQAFDSLSIQHLYAVLQLRSEVFVVEQNCLFQDMDGLDAQAMHLLGWQGNGREASLLAYARCFPAGVTFTEASIGRVVTRKAARGQGLGDWLIQKSLDSVQSLWGAQPVRIGAQAHLKPLYSRHGFADVGLPYVEDGIDHLEMLRPTFKTGDVS